MLPGPEGHPVAGRLDEIPFPAGRRPPPTPIDLQGLQVGACACTVRLLACTAEPFTARLPSLAEGLPRPSAADAASDREPRVPTQDLQHLAGEPGRGQLPIEDHRVVRQGVSRRGA